MRPTRLRKIANLELEKEALQAEVARWQRQHKATKERRVELEIENTQLEDEVRSWMSKCSREQERVAELQQVSRRNMFYNLR